MPPVTDKKRQCKIFNIGFHKTGTSSLTYFMKVNNLRTLHSAAYCMEHLGLGHQNDAGEDNGIPANVESIINPAALNQLVQEHDFFSDNPWPLLFRYLDMEYPDSKFILTRRQTENWANSLLKYAGTQNTQMRRLIYGYGNPTNHIEHYKKVYSKHNREVIDYFSGKHNFLVIDIETDDTVIASRLHDFLDFSSKIKSFPTVNKQ